MPENFAGVTPVAGATSWFLWTGHYCEDFYDCEDLLVLSPRKVFRIMIETSDDTRPSGHARLRADAAEQAAARSVTNRSGSPTPWHSWL
jgi:hypothetical protein